MGFLLPEMPSMSRLHTEFDRLYAPPGAASDAPGSGATDLLGPDGQVRALVLDIGRPVEWSVVAPLWRAVQDDLDLPAPGLAISGEQSFQLWWSLAEAVPAQDAERFLQAVQRRFLPTLKPARVRTFPARTGDSNGHNAGWTHARRVPAQVLPDQWSAFVAPGLAPVFEETPWVDFPPNEEGQAELLSALRSVSPSQWQDALARLTGPTEDEAGRTTGPAGAANPVTTSATASGTISAAPTESTLASANASRHSTDRDLSTTGLVTESFSDPRRFLLHVMNDSAVPLPLRIEAAKALLPHTENR